MLLVRLQLANWSLYTCSSPCVDIYLLTFDSKNRTIIESIYGDFAIASFSDDPPPPVPPLPVLMHRFSEVCVVRPRLCVFCNDYVVLPRRAARYCFNCGGVFHERCYRTVQQLQQRCPRTRVSSSALDERGDHDNAISVQEVVSVSFAFRFIAVP